MYALYYQRDGHPAVPVLMEKGPVDSPDTQFGYLLVDSDEKSRYQMIQKYVEDKNLKNVPGRFLFVRMQEVDAEIFVM